MYRQSKSAEIVTLGLVIWGGLLRLDYPDKSSST